MSGSGTPESPWSEISHDTTPAFAQLLAVEHFRPAGEIDADVPPLPGLYAIRVRDRAALPPEFAAHSLERGHDLIYIGVASKSLRRRFLGQELRARGHGTFFRSIGAVLGYRPVRGNLIGRANPRNFTFATHDELNIIEWINENLLVNWIEYPALQQKTAEGSLIRQHLPLLNLAGNPAALVELSRLRAECVHIANDPTRASMTEPGDPPTASFDGSVLSSALLPGTDHHRVRVGEDRGPHSR